MRLLILFVLTYFLPACKEENTSARYAKSQITALGDITDPHSLRPLPDPILALYQFDKDKNKEGVFRFRCIEDLHLNPVVEFHLPDGKSAEATNRNGDPHYREKSILSFYAKIRTSLSDFRLVNDSAQSKQYSECFSTIAEELTILGESEATKKILLVFSDLQENSAVFSCYRSENQSLLQSDPKKVGDLLNEQYHLPDDLTGIRVIFIYRPNTREEDQRYKNMNEAYRYLLENRHAQVQTQANNNYFLPWDDHH